MDPVLAHRLRRQAPLFGVLLAMLVFGLVHVAIFQPLLGRWQRAVRQAGAAGAAFDPSRDTARPALPPRVFTLLMDNSLPGPDADQRGASGTLAAEMVQSLSATAARHGLDVIVAEPGLLTLQPGAVQARAHLRLRGSYAGFVALIDDLQRSGKLWSIERFGIVPGDGSRCDIEVSIAGLVLRRAGRTS